MFKRRIVTLFLLPCVIAAGLALKFYRGPFQEFVNNIGPASVAYEILWMLLAFLFVPRRNAIFRIAVIVCVVTCCLEFLQLWHPIWLETLRGTFVGKMVLGTSFSWLDFPAYPIGCMIGYAILHSICDRCPAESESHEPPS
ncbi:MAG: DUF2809 domain-containing protein [Planctomycetota bacterium]